MKQCPRPNHVSVAKARGWMISDSNLHEATASHEIAVPLRQRQDLAIDVRQQVAPVRSIPLREIGLEGGIRLTAYVEMPPVVVDRVERAFKRISEPEPA